MGSTKKVYSPLLMGFFSLIHLPVAHLHKVGEPAANRTPSFPLAVDFIHTCFFFLPLDAFQARKISNHCRAEEPLLGFHVNLFL